MPPALAGHLLVFLCTDSLFGTFLPVYTPYGYLAVLVKQNSQQPPVSPGALQLFFNEVLHGPNLNAGFGKHLL